MLIAPAFLRRAIEQRPSSPRACLGSPELLAVAQEPNISNESCTALSCCRYCGERRVEMQGTTHRTADLSTP